MTLETVGPLSWLWNNAKVSESFPKFDNACSSSPFRFRDSKWNIILNSKFSVVTLHLNRKPNYEVYAVDTPFSVSVQVEDGTGRVLPDLCDKRNGLKAFGGCIWWRWIDDIERLYPDFQNNRTLTFRITIKETNPQTGQTRCSLSDASTQTQCPTPNTVNSFTTNNTSANSSTTNSNITDSSSINSKTDTSLFTNTSPCLVSLSEDFAKLLDEESYPDVEFHCEDFSTKAHRNVVSTRSPVLARMLRSDMVEGKTGIVEIKDMDAGTFKKFLRYLYSGKLAELSFDTAVPLYEAADLYAVHVLASRCSEFITKNLSEDNAYDILIVADAHTDLKFVEVVVEYMAKHKFPLSSERWSKFSDDQPRLANKVLNRFCQVLASNSLDLALTTVGLGGPLSPGPEIEEDLHVLFD